jgi:hypothetical protein
VTDDQKDPLAVALAIGVSGATLAGGLVLLLWRQGLLPDDASADFEKKLRQMARDFEGIDMENAASQMWAAANLLGKRPPRDRG